MNWKYLEQTFEQKFDDATVSTFLLDFEYSFFN